MLEELRSLLQTLVGLNEGAQSLTLLQVSVRAALTYLFGYFLLRVGEHRFVGKNTAFDVVLGFIFGATLSRAINGSAPFVDTLLAGAVLLGLHWLVSWMAFRFDGFDVMLNGEAIRIIEEGAVCEDAMQEERISKRLLAENLRLQGHSGDASRVQEAFYERNGTISVIPKRRSSPRASQAAGDAASEARNPASTESVRVVEVRVEDGVQTVRLELAPH